MGSRREAVLSGIDVPKPPGGLILWASMNRRRIRELRFGSIGNSRHSYEQRDNFDRLSAFPPSEQGLRAVVRAYFGQYWARSYFQILYRHLSGVGMRIAQSVMFCLLPAIICRGAAALDVDYLFMAQRSFFSAQQKGLGEAGVAFPGDISTMQHNPALLFSSLAGSAAAVAAGYGRDSLFDRHIVPLATGYGSEAGAMGLLYRYQSGNGGVFRQEVAVNLSGRLIDKPEVNGSVDFGINFRYEWMEVERNLPEMLYRGVYHLDGSGGVVHRTHIDSVSETARAHTRVRRFSTDMGFYQPGFIENLDFGLVIRNVLGYQRSRERPSVVQKDSLLGDTICDGDTLTIVERAEMLSDNVAAKRGWLTGRYRTLLLGVVYRVGSGGVSFCFPMDLELLGLFDRKLDNGFVFRGGVSALIREMFVVRLGYARQPATIMKGLTSFKNVNVFTGGAGIYVSSLSFDFYVSNGTFGMTAGYRF